MSTFKESLIARFGVPVFQLRKFKDPLKPGQLVEVNGLQFLVLKPLRRGFFTIYTVTPFIPSGVQIIDAICKMAIRKLVQFGICIETSNHDTL
jgi:hypothetical protein